MEAISPSLEDLTNATELFFRLHWPSDPPSPHPKWAGWGTFLYGSVPNYSEGGCYALFVDASLAYIGLGASKGGGRYLDSGISRRLMSHVYCSAKTSDFRQLKLRPSWLDLTAIHTIGLGDKDYLAPALESFLIRRLSPPKNRRV